MDLASMVTRVKTQGGFDVPSGDTTIKEWLNERYRRLAVQANWTKAIIDLGPVVADQGEYDFDEGVTEIHELRVGTTPYRRTGTQSLWDLQGDITHRYGEGGFYAPTFTAAQIPKVTIYPTPTEGGEAISALCTQYPTALVEDVDTPVLPEDFHPAIVDGALAEGFALIDENLATADRFEQKYALAIEDLRRRQNRRLGGGPHFVQIERVHFRR